MTNSNQSKSFLDAEYRRYMQDQEKKAYESKEEYRRYVERKVQQAMMGEMEQWSRTEGVAINDPKPRYEGPYNKDKPCKACGEPGPHHSMFVENRIAEVVPTSNIHVSARHVKDRSFIKRTCKNCGHIWHEAPLHIVPELVADRMVGEGKDEGTSME